jgi:dihydrofolate reductase
LIISLIVALDEAGCIGRQGDIPWRLRTDLQRFKMLTMGHHLIVGRKTYESIGHPLPGRDMIVITRDPEYKASGCIVTGSLEQALALARDRGEQEVFVIGGAQIYALVLPVTDKIYLTRVHAQVPCDTYFPPIDMRDWKIQEQSFHPDRERDQYPSTYQLLTRKS